jgi:NAD(P)H-nitrite reductase large subunit
MTADPSAAFKVLIAGGGVAALEGALALREEAGDRLSIEMLAPEPEFVYRPMIVAKYLAPYLEQYESRCV